MKYQPCADSAFRKTTTYCNYDYTCLTIFKKTAAWRRIYDTRDGTICSQLVVACPC